MYDPPEKRLQEMGAWSDRLGGIDMLVSWKQLG